MCFQNLPASYHELGQKCNIRRKGVTNQNEKNAEQVIKKTRVSQQINHPLVFIF